MNKIYLWAIIITAAMLGATYYTVVLTKGGINDDVVNMLAIAGAAALVIITVFVVTKYVRQMQVDEATGELVDETWDENLREYKNPLPMGWAIIYLGAMVWAMWYFTTGYPLNAYSQIGEYNEDVAVHNAKFKEKYASISGEELVYMGESVFLAECKVCHGISADGIDGKAANLNVRLEPTVVKYAIVNGANNFKTDFPGGMPAGLASLYEEGELDKVSEYVAAGFPEDDQEGAALFEKGTCVSCHGANGEGVPYAGPKLDAYDIATVVSVLKDGKKGALGIMPAFDRLNAKQQEAVGAYITSLSKGE